MKKIIYVDDISYSLISVAHRLKSRCEVFTAKSVEIMFGILAEMIPDLILLDINMPDVNGFEAIKKLKSDERYKNIPVVFLTSNGNKDSLIKGIKLGAVDYLIKPVSDSDLTDCIDLHLNSDISVTNKPIVLAIDDSPTILKSITNALRDQCTVRTLTNPEKLTELLRVLTPDLFLLDCHMPVYSGFDLVPFIRSMRDHAETPILFLTSEGTPDNIFVALDLGASDFLVKPINDELLNEKITAGLSNYIVLRRLRSLGAYG